MKHGKMASAGNFKLKSELKTFNQVPVQEFQSCKTGLTVIIAEVEGPLVNGYICLATEANDDDGLPHTLEHLVFLGSEDYPYKGILDLLANRCLAAGTNAWTAVDHTCYTVENAGSEGFLSLLPIYLDHILYPILTDQAFLTEVHHITEEGEDAGVVYCEMQARENTGEGRLLLEKGRLLYPNSGYASETGGCLENLRKSTTNHKVRQYHKDFYRPENVKVIITGQIKAKDVFKALAPLEDKIISKGQRGPFSRPWQKVPDPLPGSVEKLLKYACDDESNGIVSVTWRGPSLATEQYLLDAVTLILKYLSDYSVSPVQRDMVEVPDPYASEVESFTKDNTASEIGIIFMGVPVEKLTQVKPVLMKILKKIVEEKDINMKRLQTVIHRLKLACLSSMENDPHKTIATVVIEHALYGNNAEFLKQRLNPVERLRRLENESKDFWINLIDKYLVQGNMVFVGAVPSIEEKESMAKNEAERIEAQKASLTPAGLKMKGLGLHKAVEFNSKPAPNSVMTCVPVPSTDSINYHSLTRYSSSEIKDALDLSKAPVYTYFDHVKTNFVYLYLSMDTSKVPPELRTYMPLLLESFFESPVERNGSLISYEDVAAELQSDTLVYQKLVGIGESGKFSVGPCGQTAFIVLQVEESKYERGIAWLREILFQTRLTKERLTITATKMINDVSQLKRDEDTVLGEIVTELTYVKDSNKYTSNIIRQHRFLNNLLKQLKSSPDSVIAKLEDLRRIITNPSNLVLYLAGNIDHLGNNVTDCLSSLLLENEAPVSNSLHVIPDYELIQLENGKKSCVFGMGSTESGYLSHFTPSIKRYDDPDVPALMTYIQYITQLEGPLWKQIRGKGLSYSSSIDLLLNKGWLVLSLTKSTNLVGAFKEAQNVVMSQVKSENWDEAMFESAKSSLIFEVIAREKTVGHVVMQSLLSYFHRVDYTYNRWLVSRIHKVTKSDLNRVGKKYMKNLFNPALTKTAIVCPPSKIPEVVEGFKKMGYGLDTYTNMDDIFLK